MKDNWGSDFGNIFSRRYDDEINSKLDVNIRKSIKKGLAGAVGGGALGAMQGGPLGAAAGAGIGSVAEDTAHNITSKSNKMKKAKSGNLEQKSLDRAIESIDSLLKCLGKAPNDGLNIKNVTQSKGQVFSSKSAPKPKNKKRSS